MLKKAILFDFDDTLGDREIYAYKLYEEAILLADPNIDPFEKEMILQFAMVKDQQGDVDKNDVAKWIEEEFDFKLAHPGYDLFQDWWRGNLCKYAVLFPKSLEVLTTLKEKGYLIGVITNGPSGAQHGKLQKTGIEEMMDVVIVSGDTPYHKPDVEIFQLAADKLGVTCEDCLFVGDMFYKDVLGAKRAGMEPVYIWSHGERICNYPVHRIRSIEELLEYEGQWY